MINQFFQDLLELEKIRSFSEHETLTALKSAFDKLQDDILYAEEKLADLQEDDLEALFNAAEEIVCPQVLSIISLSFISFLLCRHSHYMSLLSYENNTRFKVRLLKFRNV